MKTTYSEFVLTYKKICFYGDVKYFGQITVKTVIGALWWKNVKIERRQITRKNTECWSFDDTGKFCEELKIKALEQSYRAKWLLNDLSITGINK